MGLINNERGQGLMSKYVWVIETIYRARKITFKELNERWLNDEISRGVDIPKRTFDNWRYAIWDMFGINIVNENCGEYRYYIENTDDINHNGLRSWIYNTFTVSNALANSQSIKDRILLEYVPSGQQYLKTIIQAMKENKVLNMTYQSYKRDEANSFDVQPYCVKLFRQRWYMIGRCTDPDYDKLMIYALDRIFSLHTTNETFKLPKNWDAQKHFNGCYGIFANKEVRIQNIKLKVSATQANYIRDLELHESQEEIEWNEEYSIFTYRLRPTFDFIQELLRNGADLEVLEPKDLRQEMANIVEQMHKIYKK
ncbi:MAG: WYL domain-containing protein [Bacteroidaceae bacterium]|nr:WYL domain-containing protein [Bacteroidaceae bacterium]